MGEQMQDYEMTEREPKPSFLKGLIFIIVLEGLNELLALLVFRPTERWVRKKGRN